MFSPLVHRLQKAGICAGAASITRHCLRVTTARLLDRLPTLGSVLYMPMRSTAAQMVNMPSGFLVEALPLAPLMRTHWMMMASAVTVDGPREWMECFDTHGRECARMYLLPDTDYLAWDAMPGCGESVADLQLLPLASDPSPASAQVLRFHTYCLAGLRLLGADLACRTSRLSRDLAGRIARDEALPLQLASGE